MGTAVDTACSRCGRERTAHEQRERSSTQHAPWVDLAIGRVSAPVFPITPGLQLMGWFLASLVHEMGHPGFA